MTPLDEFALYLELSGPPLGSGGVGGTEESAGQTSEGIRQRWSGKVVGIGVSRIDVVTALGPPNRTDDNWVAYALRTRPGYLYVFRFGPQGTWWQSGFERESLESPLVETSWTPDDWPGLIKRLASVGATEREVQKLVGPPLSVSGWWPVAVWEYPNGWIEFRHGIVEPM